MVPHLLDGRGSIYPTPRVEIYPPSRTAPSIVRTRTASNDASERPSATLSPIRYMPLMRSRATAGSAITSRVAL